MEVFDFIKNNQKPIVIRPKWEDTLQEAKNTYAKFYKGITISEEQYLLEIKLNFDKMMTLTDEEYEAHTFQQRLRTNNLLTSLDKALANHIEQVKKLKQIKEDKKLINRFKRLIHKLFKKKE